MRNPWGENGVFIPRRDTDRVDRRPRAAAAPATVVSPAAGAHPIHDFDPGRHADTGWHVAGTIFWIVFLVAVIVLGVLIVRQLMARPLRPTTAIPYGPPRSPALDELELRYARGEIGRDEYLGRRADLLAPWPGVPAYAAPPGPPQPPAAPPPVEPPPDPPAA